MPVKTIEKVIDGHTIKIVQFHAVRGFKIKARLYKLILPVLSSLIDVKDLKSAKTLLDMNINLSSGFSTLTAAMDEEKLFSLLIDLLSGAFIDNQMIDEKVFNETFIGNYNLAYKIAYEVIQANSFFDFGGIGSLMTEKLSQISPQN
jgi:hypothetical protein